jgi:histidyl-tRNA synthetase
MPAPQPVRGTHDLLPDELRRHRHVSETARAIARRYGCEEIATPIFEFSEVFQRSMGETSDVVSKEMYTFTDLGGEQLSLRPEYTAGICRAFISGGLQQHLPLKFFAHGPMFRYERPQKGRQRQFHQIDVEILGVAEPQADIEVVAIGADTLDALGVLDKCTLMINSLGDPESRAGYRRVLVEYLSDHKAALSKDSLARLERNPLRILDSKDEGDRKILLGAPELSQHLNAKSQDFFATVLAGLDRVGIKYEIDRKLVRGLDYYTHTAFEFVTTALGAQGTVIGGGRYDGLIEALGGPPTPGIGWAGGIERLAMLAANPPAETRPIAVIPATPDTEAAAFEWAMRLRRAGFVVEHQPRGRMGQRLKRAAERAGAAVAVILGPDELARGEGTLRELDSGTQSTVALDNLIGRLADFR